MYFDIFFHQPPHYQLFSTKDVPRKNRRRVPGETGYVEQHCSPVQIGSPQNVVPKVLARMVCISMFSGSRIRDLPKSETPLCLVSGRVHRQGGTRGPRQPPAQDIAQVPAYLQAPRAVKNGWTQRSLTPTADFPEMTWAATIVMPLPVPRSAGLTAARLTMMMERSVLTLPLQTEKVQLPASAKLNACRELWTNGI